jgi:hypothetical protein
MTQVRNLCTILIRNSKGLDLLGDTGVDLALSARRLTNLREETRIAHKILRGKSSWENSCSTANLNGRIILKCVIGKQWSK